MAALLQAMPDLDVDDGGLVLMLTCEHGGAYCIISQEVQEHAVSTYMAHMVRGLVDMSVAKGLPEECYTDILNRYGGGIDESLADTTKIFTIGG